MEVGLDRKAGSMAQQVFGLSYGGNLLRNLAGELVQGLIPQPAMNYWWRGLLKQIEGEL